MINTIDAARGIAHQYLNYIKSNGTVVELQTISEVINDKILPSRNNQNVWIFAAVELVVISNRDSVAVVFESFNHKHIVTWVVSANGTAVAFPYMVVPGLLNIKECVRSR